MEEENYEQYPQDDYTQPPSDMHQLIDVLTQEKSFPEDLKKGLWAFADRENTLSYLDKDAKIIQNKRLEQALIFTRMAMPHYKFSFETARDMENAQAKYNIKISRSFQGFERKMQATQIRQYHTSRAMEQQKKPGVFSRLKGLPSGLFGKKGMLQ